MEEAIATYQDIIKKFPKEGPVAAKAWFHIGLCYEKLGNREAQKAYQQVLSNYADQMVCLNRTMHVHCNPAEIMHTHGSQEMSRCEFEQLFGPGKGQD